MSPVVLPTLVVEDELFAQGFHAVIGVDEVGRGALAGPVTVGAAILTAADHRAAAGQFPTGLRDSKLLSAPRREALVEPTRAWLSAWSLGSAAAAEIDEQGIVPALGLSAVRALARLHHAGALPVPAATVVLLDGSHDWLTPLLRSTQGPPLRVVVRPKADRDCAVVAAASVLAKVARDAELVAAAEAHPGYGWEGNKGYGSTGHTEAIRMLGPSPLHRVTWLKTILSTAVDGLAPQALPNP